MNGNRRSFMKTAGAIGAIAAAGGFPAWNLVPRAFGKTVDGQKETITAPMARWAAGVKFSDLSGDAVHQAKRLLLDAMGCALGGYRQHDPTIALQVLDEIAAPGPATVIGSGKKMDCPHAAFVNALMIRCIDYNDIYWRQDPVHPSDIFPAAIACGERAKSDGRELIVGLVLGHEFEMRFAECALPGIRERGWHHATLTAFVSPIVAGRMLHLPWQQIQQAIGISASARATFGVVTAGKLTMMKDTADPMAPESGVLAALLAAKGYTGPEHVIDGKEGLVQEIASEWKLNLLTDGLGESWRISQCGMKFFPTEALTQSPISAVLDLVKDNDLKPDQIEKVQIRTVARAADILADPSKYDPHSKETADHSLPYGVAAVIVDRQVTPAQFTMAKINDPLIRAQLRKVEVIADPEFEKVFPLQRVHVTIIASGGKRFSKQLDYPKGDAHNPLSDREVEEKFTALADGVLTRPRRKRVIDAIWNLEKAGSITPLMEMLKAEKA